MLEVKHKFKSKTDTIEKIRVKVKPVNIDFDGIESRLEILPVSAGNYREPGSVKGKFIYLKFPPRDEEKAKPSLNFYDLDKKEEKTILANINDYMLSADRLKLLVQEGECIRHH